MQKKPRILFLVTEDWYFCSHRLPVARAARDAGFEVTVATRIQNHADSILNEDFKLIPIRLKRGNKNPFAELLAIIELIKIYKFECPTISHHVALKPIIYGSLAARITKVPSIVNAVTGFGYIFTSDHLQAKILKPFIKIVLKCALKSSKNRIIIQNPDDSRFLKINFGVKPERIVLIEGSGVDLKRFKPTDEPPGIPVIILPSRLLWDKGVKEFIDAAKYLKYRKTKARFILVGANDKENPSAVPHEKIQEWLQKGFIEWIGHKEDMPTVFANSHIVCLPSYGEGLPKVLIEAASCCRPIVTTDIPGCREIVKHNVNGFLIPKHSSIALAEALLLLISKPHLRKKMGIRGRKMVEKYFSEEIIVNKTMSIYNELIT